jgi:hypothetical protein
MAGVDLTTPAVVVVTSFPNFVKPPIVTFSVVEVTPLADVQVEVPPPPPEAAFPKITFPVASNDNTFVGVVETVVPEFKLLNFRPLTPAVGEPIFSHGLLCLSDKMNTCKKRK